jgi:tetratricopeptide (TPR) repeat protein
VLDRSDPNYFRELARKFELSDWSAGMTVDEWRAKRPATKEQSTPPAGEQIASWTFSEVETRFFQGILEAFTLPAATLARINALRARAGRYHDADIEWLFDLIKKERGPRYLFGMLARFWEEQSKLMDDIGYLTRASSCWREASEPSIALALVSRISSTNDRLMSIILTCRAGALLDMGHLLEARTSVTKALSLDGLTPHPFRVLGAIAAREGSYEEADEMFFEAFIHEKPENGKTERREKESALARMSGEEKQAFARYLLRSDPKGNSWVHSYLGREH